MADATWKAVERRIARAFGTERTGCTGQATPDFETDWIVAEIKHRKALPKWLAGALEQVLGHKRDAKLPIVILHEKSKRDSLVLLRLSDFLSWFVR